MHQILKSYGLIGYFVFILSILAGCSSNLQLRFIGHPELNNGGNSVVVRFYQLKSDAGFRQATIESFWQDDSKALGNDLLDKMEITLLPGETKAFKVKKQKQAHYIAAAADFFKPDRDNWRQVVSLDTFHGKDVWVVVGSDKIVISEAKK